MITYHNESEDTQKEVVNPIDEAKQATPIDVTNQKSLSPPPDTTEEGQQDRDEGHSEQFQKDENGLKNKELITEFVNQMKICQWKGMLKDLEKHIYGVNATEDNTSADLPSQSSVSEKDSAVSHPQCAFSCGFCHVTFVPSLDWFKHFQMCPKFPVYCPYQCGF
ncbi:hypothetical protein RFI_20163, partial [Reticulomyxa filosa]